jgi:hypothetical protein
MRVASKDRAKRETTRRTPQTVLKIPSGSVLSSTGEPIEQASLIFDPEWYVAEYPDVAAAGVDPVQHFLKAGFSEGRNPNRYFDSAWYSGTYPDVAAHGENPFVHYLFYGAREGRKPRAGK